MYKIFNSFTCTHECAGLFSVLLPSLHPDYGVLTEDQRGALALYTLFTEGNDILDSVQVELEAVAPAVLAAIQSYISFEKHTPESVRNNGRACEWLPAHFHPHSGEGGGSTACDSGCCVLCILPTTRVSCLCVKIVNVMGVSPGVARPCVCMHVCIVAAPGF